MAKPNKKPEEYRLLTDGFSIPFCPALSVALGNGPTGITKAILVQQVHYWCCINQSNERNSKETFRNGYWWTYISLSNWCKYLPCCSDTKIQNTLKTLREDGILVAAALDAKEGKQHLWYRVNYEVLSEILKKYPETTNLTLNDCGVSQKNLPRNTVGSTSIEL